MWRGDAEMRHADEYIWTPWTPRENESFWNKENDPKKGTEKHAGKQQDPDAIQRIKKAEPGDPFFLLEFSGAVVGIISNSCIMRYGHENEKGMNFTMSTGGIECKKSIHNDQLTRKWNIMTGDVSGCSIQATQIVLMMIWW